jgi:hypothetical protein
VVTGVQHKHPEQVVPVVVVITIRQPALLELRDKAMAAVTESVRALLLLSVLVAAVEQVLAVQTQQLEVQAMVVQVHRLIHHGD